MSARTAAGLVLAGLLLTGCDGHVSTASAPPQATSAAPTTAPSPAPFSCPVTGEELGALWNTGSVGGATHPAQDLCLVTTPLYTGDEQEGPPVTAVVRRLTGTSAATLAVDPSGLPGTTLGVSFDPPGLVLTPDDTVATTAQTGSVDDGTLATTVLVLDGSDGTTWVMAIETRDDAIDAAQRVSGTAQLFAEVVPRIR